MGVKASEVGDWLRQRAGKRNHGEVLSDDVVVIRPGSKGLSPPSEKGLLTSSADQTRPA